MRVSADGRRFFYVWDNQPNGYELRAIDAVGATPRVIFSRANARLAAGLVRWRRRSERRSYIRSGLSSWPSEGEPLLWIEYDRRQRER